MGRVGMFERLGLVLGGVGIGILTYSLLNKDQLRYRVESEPYKKGFGAPEQDYLKFGFPGPISDIRKREGYVASFNRQTRNPNFVMEHLTVDSLKKADGTSRDHSKFMEDDGVPQQFRAKLKDYAKSGYDRGHMVPAADIKFSQKAMDETFYLTNMAPQVGKKFNRGYWAYFEEFCRRMTQQFGSVYVITGPLYLPSKSPNFPDPNKYYVQYEVIGDPPNVAVPTHFFKIILAVPSNLKEKPSLAGFVLPNKEIPEGVPLERFVTPVDVIEKAAGIVFFDRLGPNKIKELPHLCTTTQCQLNKKFIEKVQSYNN